MLGIHKRRNKRGRIQVNTIVCTTTAAYSWLQNISLFAQRNQQNDGDGDGAHDSSLSIYNICIVYISVSISSAYSYLLFILLLFYVH